MEGRVDRVGFCQKSNESYRSISSLMGYCTALGLFSISASWLTISKFFQQFFQFSTTTSQASKSCKTLSLQLRSIFNICFNNAINQLLKLYFLIVLSKLSSLSLTILYFTLCQEPSMLPRRSQGKRRVISKMYCIFVFAVIRLLPWIRSQIIKPMLKTRERQSIYLLVSTCYGERQRRSWSQTRSSFVISFALVSRCPSLITVKVSSTNRCEGLTSLGYIFFSAKLAASCANSLPTLKITSFSISDLITISKFLPKLSITIQN